MKDQEQPRIEILDVNPQESPAHYAPELNLPDDDQLAQEYIASQPQVIQHENVVRVRHEQGHRIGKIKTAIYAGGAALALFGAYQLYRGLTSGGGSHMQAEVTVDETRVTVYENAPLQLAGIDSDLSLHITAGYDRTGPIPGIDINPINNMYEFDQDGLTTHTEATLTVETMQVEENDNDVVVTLGGDMNLSRASIDWKEQEFAGADITGSSYSVGNNLKDQIDNDALEILQDSAGVTAACGLMDNDIQPALTKGVETLLKIVKPELIAGDKSMRVEIEDLHSQAQGLYVDAKDELQATLHGIESDYDGKNDTFEADISQILDCQAQDIRLVQPEASRR